MPSKKTKYKLTVYLGSRVAELKVNLLRKSEINNDNKASWCKDVVEKADRVDE